MPNTDARLIDSFIIDGEQYDHLIFTNDDDRVELQSNGEVLLTYDSGLSVFTPDGHVMGYVKCVSEYEWMFVSKDPMLTDRGLKETHAEVILHLEVLVSKEYVTTLNAQKALKQATL